MRRAPGAFGVGRVVTIASLADRAMGTLAASLARGLQGDGPVAGRCRGGGRFAPKATFRSARAHLDRAEVTVAVLPLSGAPARREAGRLVALELVRHLSGVPGVRVLEPGVVRARLLRSRVLVDAGLALDTVHETFDALGVDLLLGGDVSEFADSGDGARVAFTASLFARGSDELVWQTTSDGSGAEVVGFFGTGRITTASGLACELVSSAVDRFPRAGP